MRVEVCATDWLVAWRFSDANRDHEFTRSVSERHAIVLALRRALAEAESQLAASTGVDDPQVVEYVCAGLTADVLAELDVRDQINRRARAILDDRVATT